MTVSVRRITPEDSEAVFNWRNDPATRAASINTEPVKREIHDAWFSRALMNPRIVMYIAEDSSNAAEPLGMCRFNFTEDSKTAEVSINMNPSQRGRKKAQPVLHAALQEVLNERPSLTAFTATIRKENIASFTIFGKEGFSLTEEQDGVLTLDRPSA